MLPDRVPAVRWLPGAVRRANAMSILCRLSRARLRRSSPAKQRQNRERVTWKVARCDPTSILRRWVTAPDAVVGQGAQIAD